MHVKVKARITSKGQITLPKEVREHFAVGPGDDIEFVSDEAGIRLRRVIPENYLEEWVGYLDERRSTDELMDEVRGPVEEWEIGEDSS